MDKRKKKKKKRERSETYQGDPSPTPNNFLISALTGNKRAIEVFATFFHLYIGSTAIESPERRIHGRDRCVDVHPARAEDGQREREREKQRKGERDRASRLISRQRGRERPKRKNLDTTILNSREGPTRLPAHAISRS